ncbi:MAG: 4-(cytidine 5'-diphospho)-2-C-methyl-D-erythritol kinase [Bacteroidales bacterium]|jgi:4-diphosphocytidyl-2-C-methyl-D-erythritol kinase|nr:4-(cytidine 5'-diphospho)-2-C-methyl-D-erythritol kinase [Bacteroidales bacterium]
MVIFPSCKINLGLHINAKRTDGFHDIETVFYPVYGYSDVLEIITSDKSEYGFQQKGIPIYDTDINLVEKAYLLLREKYHLPSVDMFLYKNIPVGAGLGGSSSDAAFTLKLLDTVFNLHLDNKTLKEYATQLGSDCPFFIDTVPATGTNRGDELVACSIPQLSKKYLVIVSPNIFISTAEAYKSCETYQRNISLLEVISQPLSYWKDTLINDFEKTIFPLYPELQSIKENLYHQGAMYASLTGSGSSLYGIFKEEPLALEFNPDYFLYQGWLF